MQNPVAVDWNWSQFVSSISVNDCFSLRLLILFRADTDQPLQKLLLSLMLSMLFPKLEYPEIYHSYTSLVTHFKIKGYFTDSFYVVEFSFNLSLYYLSYFEKHPLGIDRAWYVYQCFNEDVTCSLESE